MNIYFDNAATTPPLPCLQNFHANPSSPHLLGIAAERELYAARSTLSNMLNVTPAEITFTSGGTESNNLALIGYALANRRKNTTFVAAPWEHPSILEPLRFIQEQQLGNVIITPVENYQPIPDTPTLVAFSHVNHETGDIADIAVIAKRLKSALSQTIVLVDGVQGFCKEPLETSNIDMLSLSAHKCHGSTGVGALMAKKHVRLLPLMHGGGQEQKLRPGTENLAGITHFARTAVGLHKQQNTHHSHVSDIKAVLAEIATTLPGVHINAISANTTPYILNLSFVGLKGEILVHTLSQRGIHASMGAACQSRKKVTTTLEHMGFSAERAASAVRFSFSHLNTVEEATAAKATIIECVNQMRKVLGVKL